MAFIDVHYHTTEPAQEFQDKLLKEIKSLHNKINTMATSIKDLSAQVDTLQTSLDAKQEQIQTAIDALSKSITDLNNLIVEGGSEADRQAIADKLTALKADLESTSTTPTGPVEPPTGETP